MTRSTNPLIIIIVVIIIITSERTERKTQCSSRKSNERARSLQKKDWWRGAEGGLNGRSYTVRWNLNIFVQRWLMSKPEAYLFKYCGINLKLRRPPSWVIVAIGRTHRVRRCGFDVTIFSSGVLRRVRFWVLNILSHVVGAENWAEQAEYRMSGTGAVSNARSTTIAIESACCSSLAGGNRFERWSAILPLWLIIALFIYNYN